MSASARPDQPVAIQSTSTPSATRSAAGWIASAPRQLETNFLDGLTDDLVAGLPWLWEFWAMPHQFPPEGAWRTWVILGGRGAGKTRAGAEWVRMQVEGARPTDPGRASRLALVGETLDQVREVMVFGDSGILACSPPDRRPQWEATRRRLIWPNGAVATAYSAHSPEALRGPQFDAAWADELAKWKNGEAAWDMLQFCLRLGDDPRACVTTTPRNAAVLQRLLAASSTVTTHAGTAANRANLAPGFIAEVMERYGATRLGRQELDGLLLEDVEAPLWTRATLDAARIGAVPVLGRVVVAVDPPVTAHAGSDECGIVVVGLVAGGDGGRAVVLEDASVTAATPQAWAEAAVSAMRRHGADRMVAEANQGGDLVESVVRMVDRTVSYRKVHASRGKVARAEPVAALYEQGRVAHVAGLNALETQMCLMSAHGYQGRGSPDRVDALVWALTELVVSRSVMRDPSVRTLR